MNCFKLMMCFMACVASVRGEYDFSKLQELTGLSEGVVKRWMSEFQSIEDWNESPATYYKTIANMINEHGFKKTCEIGVSTGGNSYTILQQTNVEKLYSIDPYDPAYWIDLNRNNVLDLYYLRIKMRLEQFGDRCEVMRMGSEEASLLIKDGELDFIFIDGDHTYEAVSKDLQCWYSKIRKGGIISGDDYWHCHPAVIRAVDDFFGAMDIKINQCKDEPRIWWVQIK